MALLPGQLHIQALIGIPRPMEGVSNRLNMLECKSTIINRGTQIDRKVGLTVNTYYTLSKNPYGQSDITVIAVSTF